MKLNLSFYKELINIESDNIKRDSNKRSLTTKKTSLTIVSIWPTKFKLQKFMFLIQKF